MKTLIVILFLFSSSFICHANSLEYTVLSDEETKLLIKDYLSVNDLWYGVYLYDSEGKEEKIGYMNTWHELADNYSSYKKSVIIDNTEMHFEIFTGEAVEATDSITKQVYQADPPYNLLYDFESDTTGGSYVTTTSTRQKNTMQIVRSDGVNKEIEILENFDFRLNHYLTDLIFLLPNQNFIGNSVKSEGFGGGIFSDSIFTFVEIKKQIVKGVPYEYLVYDVTWDYHEFAITGKMLVDPKNFIPILTRFEEVQMEIRLEDKEIAKNINNQKDFYLLDSIPLDRDYSQILENNSHTEVKNIFIEIQGNYNNHFPTSSQQEVIQVEGINYLVLGDVYAGSEYGIWEEATKSDIQENLEKKNFDPIDDPKIIRLANKGINGATKIEDKITNLLAFVSDYIEDTYIVGSVTTVYDIIEQKSGDCSEHSFLFNTLARSIGIPSRMVSGYAYDPQSQSFGGHAWNEVVFDGYWYQVDPTWNWGNVFGHIKQGEELNPLINDLKFRLALIEFENGEEIVF